MYFSFLAVTLWLEFVQFAIGGVGKCDDGLKKIREIFDSAVTACGLHVTKGSLIWETYREYENAISCSALVSSYIFLPPLCETGMVEIKLVFFLQRKHAHWW